MSNIDSHRSERHDAAPTRSTSLSRRAVLTLLGLGSLGSLSGLATAHPTPDDDDGAGRPEDDLHGHGAPDPSGPLLAHDASTSDVVSDGPFADVIKHLGVAGHGERLLPEGTTDVWALDGYAYLGTFQTPCGTGEGFDEGELIDDLLGPGIAVFDVHNPNEPSYVGNIPSVEGSRSNDVKVANMNAGAILVHTNEPCDGGPGGFEIYGVEDPTEPDHLAHVQTDDINELLRDSFGFVDFGVHNLFLFSQDDRDYVAAVVESLFGNFQLFDITDPTSPIRVGAWGAESLFLPTVDWASTTDFSGTILPGNAYLFDGFGTSRNRFLHDVTISEDGTRAYLANWDAGLVLLDVSDPSDPTLVSVAIDPSAGDGEVNSHAAWPSEDGRIVVETEEDFDPFALTFALTSGPNAGDYEAIEGAFTTPIASEPNRTMSGSTTYIGLACDASTVPEASAPGQIAVAQRGACRFDTKAQHAIDAGYAGLVVFNDAARGDAVIVMGGEPRDIPGVFVGHSTGLAIFDVSAASDLTIGDAGAAIEATTVPERWGNVRIWDYSDETNPVLASEFDTVCSADPVDESCDPRGTYSVHNVVVEREKAYISWYSDGVLILDIADPTAPVETARFSPEGEEFEEDNGGIQDVWGIYKEPRRPWIYASDRNGGLYVLKEYGSGSSKRGR